MAKDIKDPTLKKPTPVSFGAEKGNSPLFKFFIEGLKDIYWAEKQLIVALPKMEAAATTNELTLAVGEHLAQTNNHVRRLEKIFAIIGHPAEGKVCFAMQGLLKEADSIVEETDEGSMTRDAAIIMAAQKVEHYEIATYGSLTEYAKLLGLNDVHGLLQLTLDEERMTDQGLTLIAQNKINWEAELEEVSEGSANLN
ncbi:MAG TPA: ferritin-like domain-containing protein [Chitinophagaceae bacterium]|jgi:ferritin-like metal-binding protein YciE|nr:ferritin-like domain-containing protein [Chitinophagaceae bacterium]